MAMTTSREKVLGYLQKHRTATAQDLARDLQMTPANARHHLSRLQADGLVRVVAQRPAAGRGRPVLVYGVSDEWLGHNLDGLTLALLKLLAAHYPDRERLLAAAAAALAGDDAAEWPLSLTPRLNALVDWLNARHYHARWEAHADGPRVILAHCPYRAALDACPSLCRLDVLLLARLLNHEVSQIARLELSRQGVPLCVFQIGRS